MESLVQQISVSTSVTIARFLAHNLQSVMSTLDACVVSVMVIMASYTFGPKLQMSILSRRLAVLLLFHSIEPLLMTVVGVDPHVQSLMINAGILVIISVVPPDVSPELETIVTSVIYIYSDALAFLVGWRRERLSILVVLLLFFRVSVHVLQGRLQQIASYTLMTTVGSIVLDNGSDVFMDEKLFRYSMFLIILHAVTTDITEQVENTCLLAYVNFVTVTFASESFVTVVCAFFVCVLCKRYIGIQAWPTRVCVLLGVNMLVQTTLAYMQRLAVNDTFVTLKTAALVVQFAIHVMGELSLRLANNNPKG